jgi:hypothetical protein
MSAHLKKENNALMPKQIMRYQNDQITNGHLIRCPEKHFANFLYPQKQEHDTDEECKFNAILFKTKEQIKQYKEYSEQNKAFLVLPTRDDDINKLKSPKAWMPNFQGENTWTNRELQWFESEKCLVFGLNNEIQCNTWIIFLSWVCNI